jgi:prepilin-type N-terminal cleavage/methylation domain-containing protein
MAKPYHSNPRNGSRPAGARRAGGGFTLLEVMIATVILALAVVMTVGILGGARARILRAETRWGREHLLSQAAELYLLGGLEAEIPPGLLPEGFSSSCTLTAVEDLSEQDAEPQQGWILGRFDIRVFDTGHDLMAECSVEKLVREEDCE